MKHSRELLIALSLAGLAACSETTRPGADAGDTVAPDLTTDTGTPVEPEDSGIDVPRDRRESTDTYINIFDLFPIPDSGYGAACAICLRDMCGMQINACVNSAVCRDGLACAMRDCLGGARRDGGGTGPGGLDLACLNRCFDNNLAALFTAVGALTCTFGTCGATCAGSLIPDAGPRPDVVMPPPDVTATDSTTPEDAPVDATAPADVAPE